MNRPPVKISEHLSDHYDHIYSRAKEETEWLDIQANNKIRNILRLCSNCKHDSVLDIGAGTGSVIKGLSGRKFGQAFWGLDISEKAVEIVKRRNIATLVECKLFDGYNIPYSSDEFDLAIISHVIEHSEFPRTLLYEAARVARFVYVEVPLEETIRLKKDFVLDAAGHINFYNSKTIRLLLQTCNFQVLRQTTSNSSARSYEYLYGNKGLALFLVKEAALRIAPSMARSFFEYDSALICQKMNWRESQK
jgi:ubiquinone/menaquinone biosynthesis C-methylase UbiE